MLSVSFRRLWRLRLSSLITRSTLRRALAWLLGSDMASLDLYAASSMLVNSLMVSAVVEAWL